MGAHGGPSPVAPKCGGSVGGHGGPVHERHVFSPLWSWALPPHLIFLLLLPSPHCTPGSACLWLLCCPLLAPSLCLCAWLSPTVDGKWQAWASWGGCSVTCGGGTQRRERACLGPFFGGVACQGPQDEYRQCSAQRCPGECRPCHSGTLGKGILNDWGRAWGLAPLGNDSLL